LDFGGQINSGKPGMKIVLIIEKINPGYLRNRNV